MLEDQRAVQFDILALEGVAKALDESLTVAVAMDLAACLMNLVENAPLMAACRLH